MPRTARELNHAIAIFQRLANSLRAQGLRHEQSANLLQAELHQGTPQGVDFARHAAFFGMMAEEADRAAADWCLRAEETRS
jgi:hypothetical protein